MKSVVSDKETEGWFPLCLVLNWNSWAQSMIISQVIVHWSKVLKEEQDMSGRGIRSLLTYFKSLIDPIEHFITRNN